MARITPLWTTTRTEDTPAPKAPELALPKLDKLDRKWLGTRVGYVLAAVLCHFGTMYVITNYGTSFPDPETIKALAAAGATIEPTVVLDQEQVWSSLQWLIGAIGVAVVGDTARPSGKKKGSFGIAANGA